MPVELGHTLDATFATWTRAESLPSGVYNLVLEVTDTSGTTQTYPTADVGALQLTVRQDVAPAPTT